MPATSDKQKRFMDAAAHNPAFAKKAGVPVSVAKDFSKASKGAKFGGSGSRADSQVVNRPKTNQGKTELFSKGGNTMASKMNPGMMAMMAKKKDGMHKMPDGKMMKNSAMKKMAPGGMTKMGSVKTNSKPDGVAVKGKTQGTMIKMKNGGKAC
jgi:hypothetical protein